MRFGSLDDGSLRRQFSWLARSGVGARFGSRSISWYQAHQTCAIDVLAHKAGIPAATYHTDFEARVRQGVVEVRRPGKPWRKAGSPRDLYAAADRCARR